jgi:glycosyltransferase involved in cell wall biosynthesis
VSVIMPSYQHVHFIPEAIESVLAQTFTDLELIIIDDGSTDGSDEIIRDFAARDSRVNLVLHTSNQGIPRTVNEGLTRATGTYVAFLASDDVWAPDKLQKQVDIFSRDENLIIWSEGRIIDENGTQTGEIFTQMNYSSGRKKSGFIFEDLLKGNHILASSMIFKRENLKGIQFNNQLKYLNDFQFNVDMARLYKFWFITEPLVDYRVHSRSTLRTDYDSHITEYLKIEIFFLKKYGREISNNTRLQILTSITDILQFFISQQKNSLNIPGTGFRLMSNLLLYHYIKCLLVLEQFSDRLFRFYQILFPGSFLLDEDESIHYEEKKIQTVQDKK